MVQVSKSTFQITGVSGRPWRLTVSRSLILVMVRVPSLYEGAPLEQVSRQKRRMFLERRAMTAARIFLGSLVENKTSVLHQKGRPMRLARSS
jgi:hypothetical protein